MDFIDIGTEKLEDIGKGDNDQQRWIFQELLSNYPFIYWAILQFINKLK